MIGRVGCHGPAIRQNTRRRIFKQRYVIVELNSGTIIYIYII